MMAQLQTIGEQATAINEHHRLACLRANEAVNHAQEAGRLLLAVKSSLPHGDFGQWLTANIEVTPRQAQRYMAASLGKPLPIRALTANATPVSYLEVNEGEAVHLEFSAKGWTDAAFIFPDSTKPGFFHYVFMNGTTDDPHSQSYTQQSMNARAVGLAAWRDMSGLTNATVKRFPSHPGFAANPFGQHENTDFARELVLQFLAADPDLFPENETLYKLLGGDDYGNPEPLPGDHLSVVMALRRAYDMANEPCGKKAHPQTQGQRDRVLMLIRTLFLLLGVK